jgi:nucleoside-diphosphate-sugar epimerase
MLQSRITYKTTKAQERLGWSARVSLEEGIRRCEPWLREKGLLR